MIIHNEPQPIHSCPNCTCAVRFWVELSWSDRLVLVNPEAPCDIAEVIVNCCLDHSYDRDYGIPHGLPPELCDLLTPVIFKHMDAVDKGWPNKTIEMTDEQRDVFMAELTTVIKEYGPW